MAPEVQAFAAGLFARRGIQEQLENTLPHFIQITGPVNNFTAVDVHVFRHAIVHI